MNKPAPTCIYDVVLESAPKQRKERLTLPKISEITKNVPSIQTLAQAALENIAKHKKSTAEDPLSSNSCHGPKREVNQRANPLRRSKSLGDEDMVQLLTMEDIQDKETTPPNREVREDEATTPNGVRRRERSPSSNRRSKSPSTTRRKERSPSPKRAMSRSPSRKTGELRRSKSPDEEEGKKAHHHALKKKSSSRRIMSPVPPSLARDGSVHRMRSDEHRLSSLGAVFDDVELLMEETGQQEEEPNNPQEHDTIAAEGSKSSPRRTKSKEGKEKRKTRSDGLSHSSHSPRSATLKKPALRRIKSAGQEDGEEPGRTKSSTSKRVDGMDVSSKREKLSTGNKPSLRRIKSAGNRGGSKSKTIDDAAKGDGLSHSSHIPTVKKPTLRRIKSAEGSASQNKKADVSARTAFLFAETLSADFGRPNLGAEVSVDGTIAESTVAGDVVKTKEGDDDVPVNPDEAPSAGRMDSGSSDAPNPQPATRRGLRRTKSMDANERALAGSHRRGRSESKSGGRRRRGRSVDDGMDSTVRDHMRVHAGRRCTKASTRRRATSASPTSASSRRHTTEGAPADATNVARPVDEPPSSSGTKSMKSTRSMDTFTVSWCRSPRPGRSRSPSPMRKYLESTSLQEEANEPNATTTVAPAPTERSLGDAVATATATAPTGRTFSTRGCAAGTDTDDSFIPRASRRNPRSRSSSPKRSPSPIRKKSPPNHQSTAATPFGFDNAHRQRAAEAPSSPQESLQTVGMGRSGRVMRTRTDSGQPITSEELKKAFEQELQKKSIAAAVQAAAGEVAAKQEQEASGIGDTSGEQQEDQDTTKDKAKEPVPLSKSNQPYLGALTFLDSLPVSELCGQVGSYMTMSSLPVPKLSGQVESYIPSLPVPKLSGQVESYIPSLQVPKLSGQVESYMTMSDTGSASPLFRDEADLTTNSLLGVARGASQGDGCKQEGGPSTHALLEPEWDMNSHALDEDEFAN